jgi:co-chaperonin GroES (HSP10)
LGQKVLLPEYGGMKVDVSGSELYLYRDTDVLGIVEK